MTVVPTEGSRFVTMEKVADLTMHGYTPTQIAKQLDIKRKDVIELQADYKEALSKDSLARDLARDHLNLMVKHYDQLIKKFYDLITEIDSLDFNHQVAGQKNSALKQIADLEAKRIDLLARVGLLEDNTDAAELEEAQRKQDILISILRNDLCPECKAKVAFKLSEITKQAEVVEVVQ